MTSMHGSIYNGEITLTEDGDVTGIVNGSVVIAPGVRARIRGIVNGGVMIGRDADVLISGIVNGGVRNDGGSVTVTGIKSG